MQSSFDMDIGQVLPNTRLKDRTLDEVNKLSLRLQLFSAGISTNKKVSKLVNICEEILREKIFRSEDSLFIKSLKKIVKAKSVALVLKGPSLKTKQLGSFIDTHDLVIRVNFSDQTDADIYREQDEYIVLCLFFEGVCQAKKLFFRKCS